MVHCRWCKEAIPNGVHIHHCIGISCDYYLDGKFHREDGPAIEWNDGTKSWYINGIGYSSEEEYIQNLLPPK